MSQSDTRLEKATGLAVALGLPALIIWVRNTGLAPESVFDQRLVSTAGIWCVSALVLLWLSVAEQEPLSSIGLRRPSGADLGFGAGAGLLGLAGIFAADRWLSGGATSPALDSLSTLPAAMRAVLVVTSGVAEELLFIVYPVTRLRSLVGRKWVAAALTVAVFTAIHAPGRTVLDLAEVAGVAMLFVTLFLWRSNLWANMLAHAIVDFVPLLVIPALGARVS